MRLWDLYHGEIPGFLEEAAQTAAMERLKDVGMNCGCEYTSFPLFAHIGPYSRYDHSMGVALIVWHFTADPAQAMSGLLHDIATPAFAHVVDFLRGDHLKQESTEQGTADMIRSSGPLQAVLQRYALPPDAVTDYHRYPIADNDPPGLSADRLEYTLGNGVNFGIISGAQAAELYADLAVGRNESGETELVFRHLDAARAFAMIALECSEIYVSDPDRYAMQHLAELLKRGIEGGILSEGDLWLPEPAIIGKLEASPLAHEWVRFCGLSEILRADAPGPEGLWLKVPAKKRFIDPCVMDAGRVSALVPVIRERLRAFREASQEVWLSAR